MSNKNIIYDEETIEHLYQQNLDTALERLASLTVAEGRVPNIKGLNGWIYEQTIHYCLCQELLSQGFSPTIREQVSLYGRVKIDLLVDHAAIEIKALGSFGKDDEKYKGYRAKVEERGWIYFYLTRCETYKPYRSATISTFGKDRTFFLDEKGEWTRFIKEVTKVLIIDQRGK